MYSRNTRRNNDAPCSQSRLEDRSTCVVLVTFNAPGIAVPRYLERKVFVVGNTHLCNDPVGKRKPVHHWRLIVKSDLDSFAGQRSEAGQCCSYCSPDLEKVVFELPREFSPNTVTKEGNPFELVQSGTEAPMVYITLFFEKAPGAELAPFPPLTIPYQVRKAQTSYTRVIGTTRYYLTNPTTSCGIF